jgi:hypothetical protein
MSGMLRVLISLTLLAFHAALAPAVAPMTAELGLSPSHSCGLACHCDQSCLCARPQHAGPPAPMPSTLPVPNAPTLDRNLALAELATPFVQPRLDAPTAPANPHPAIDHSEKSLARLVILRI